jgi:hypothetical protein
MSDSLVTSRLVTVARAPQYVAARLSVPLYKAAELLELSGVRPFRHGMRSWYRLADLDAWIERESAR